ncbi:MAG: translocation/assembly module TamB domain-containing protein [Nibricoccus sp.]
MAVVILAALTLPWWMRALLAAAQKPAGIRYSRYERIGYSRFAVHDLRLEREGVVVTVRRAEVDTPLVWGWREFKRTQTPVVASGWRVEIKSEKKKTEPDPQAGWEQLRGTLLKIADALERWAPEIRAERGEVVFDGGPLSVEKTAWRDRTLTVENLGWRGKVVRGSAAFPKGKIIDLKLNGLAGRAEVALHSEEHVIDGKGKWAGQPVTLHAVFGERGWLPNEAQVTAENWSVDARELKLQEGYSRFRGTGRLNWKKDGFVVDVAANGEPIGEAPKFEITLHGRGDLDTFTLETLHATVPGLDLNLSEAVRLSRDAQLLSGPSRLALRADLAAQPWFPGSGKVAGELLVRPGPDATPEMDARLFADSLVIGRFAVPRVEVTGKLKWPRVEAFSARMVFGTGEQLSLVGAADLQKKTIESARLEGAVKSVTLKTLSKATPDFGEAKVSAQIEGSWKNPSYRGSVHLSALRLAPLRTSTVDVNGEGEGSVVRSVNATITAGESRIVIVGSVDPASATINALRIQKGTTTWLGLENPARVLWQSGISLAPSVLAGEAGRIEATGVWAPRGEVRLLVKDFSSNWLGEWLDVKHLDSTIGLLDISARWTEKAPMEFSVNANASVDIAQRGPVQLFAKASGGKDGVVLEQLRVLESNQEALIANGRIGVIVRPHSQPSYELLSAGPLELTANTRPDAPFWSYLRDAAGIIVESPELNLALSGKVADPHGVVTLRVPKAALDPKRFKAKTPTAEGLEVMVKLDQKLVLVEKLSASVDGQLVTGAGQLPLDQETLGQIREASWRKLLPKISARVSLPRVDLTAVSLYAPTLVAPKGILSAEVAVEKGDVNGYVRIDDAGTRPLGPLGVLQNVKADLSLKKRKLEVRTLDAKMGGQLITVKGSASLSEDGEPKFEFTARGENLPFVRQVGLLLRGDLDLKLSSGEGGNGIVTGKVNLRQSLFSTDVRDLMPRGGGGGSAGRPPFFAVEQAPFSAWKLDVDLSGDRFMRIRTPVFNGLASMKFHLGNILGEPRATGQAVIDEGVVMLPFANFTLQQGSVRLTEENPYEPALFITGTSRRYGYDLRLEVNGSASAPELKFSSSPPLDSEQILLLVMAGETPNDEVTYSSGQRAVKFGEFIGKSLFSSISGDSGQQRLEISSGEKISRQGRETYEVEYRLGERWALIGEYDEFDDYNAGLKWRALKDDPRKGKDAKK